MSATLASGAPLTAETWADFVARLRHHCRGEGVSRHYTASALFWPIKHPYWCTGWCGERSVLVAYADDEAEVLRLWPDAEEIDAMPATEYQFTSRFPRPAWWQEAGGNA